MVEVFHNDDHLHSIPFLDAKDKIEERRAQGDYLTVTLLEDWLTSDEIGLTNRAWMYLIPGCNSTMGAPVTFTVLAILDVWLLSWWRGVPLWMIFLNAGNCGGSEGSSHIPGKQTSGKNSKFWSGRHFCSGEILGIQVFKWFMSGSDISCCWCISLTRWNNY